MHHIDKDLTIDELIAVLVALKTPKMAPPPNLNLPRPIIKAMAGFSSEGEKSGDNNIKADLRVEDDENWHIGLNYNHKRDSLS